MKPPLPSRDRAALERIKLYRALQWLKALFKKEPEPPMPDLDPYACVTAPKKPRPSTRSGAAVMELPEE